MSKDFTVFSDEEMKALKNLMVRLATYAANFGVGGWDADEKAVFDKITGATLSR